MPNVYDVRAHERLKVDRENGRLVVQAKLPAGAGTLLAVVRAAPKIGLKTPAAVRQGDSVKIILTANAPSRRVVRLKVRQPDGSDAPWLTRNLLLHGEQTITAAVALNDKPGKWTATATDVATGARTAGEFVVLDRIGSMETLAR